MEDLCGKTLIVLGKNIHVLSLLGHGKGGYSYLAESEGKPLVLKAIHHEPCSYYAFGNKIEAEKRDYQTLSRIGVPIPKLIGVDEEKEIILKEYVEGPTVKDLIEQGRDVTDLIKQVKIIADNAKTQGINIDYYPTNFVVQDGKPIYVDYECNAYMEKWDFDHWGITTWKKD